LAIARCASENKIPYLVFKDKRPRNEVIDRRVLRNGNPTIEADKSVSSAEKCPMGCEIITLGCTAFNLLK